MPDISFMNDPNWEHLKSPLIPSVWVEDGDGRYFCTQNRVVLASWLGRGAVIIDDPRDQAQPAPVQEGA